MKFAMRFILILLLIVIWLTNIVFAGFFSGGPSRFPHGLSSQGVPILSGGGKLETTGTVFFVDSVTGNNTSSGKEIKKALATLEYALENKVTSGKGDIVAILPGHAETIDSTILVIASNTYVVGMGKSPKQHKFTFEIGENVVNDTPIDVDVDNVIFDNIYIVLASTATADTAVFDVDANGFQLRNTIIDFAGQDKMEGVNLNGGYDQTIEGCKFINPAAGEGVIVINSTRTTVVDCEFDFGINGNGVGVEQAAAEVASITIAYCTFVGDSSDQVMVTWNADPGDGHSVYLNYVLGSAANADALGATDTDMDYFLSNNYIDATTGTPTVADPSP